MITSGHRSISDQFICKTDHVSYCTVKMTDQGAQAKRRTVLRSSVDKWIAENDKVLNTSVWLKYDTDPFDRTRVLSLKCSICSCFKDRLVGRRNYSSAFVDGSGNLRASSFKDHAASDMHSRAMLLLKKQVRSLGLIANSVYAGLSAGVHGPMPVRSNRSQNFIEYYVRPFFYNV